MPQTMSTSERSSGPAGFSGPREACTADIESSTVTRWSTPPVRSRSLRPRAGRISAAWPQRTCERLSLVETITVRSAFSIASSVTRVSGAAETKLPPIPMKKRASPSRSARIASTVSRPCSRGGSKPYSARSASRKSRAAFSQIPMVRSPWTLECPRTGHSPAPGRPMLPCEQGDVDELLDGVHRVAVLGDAHRPAVHGRRRGRSASRRPRGSAPGRARSPAPPRPSPGRARGRRTPRTRSCSARRSRGRSAPCSSSSAPIACQSARSPLTRIGRCRSERPVPTPVRPRTVCGFWKRSSPASGSGLIDRIRAPFSLAISSARQHPRVVGAGVLAADHDEVGGVDVLELTPSPCRCRSSRRARPRSTRGTCSSSRAGCWCRRPGRTAGRRTPPRSTSCPRCRRSPRPGCRGPSASRR